MFTELNGPHATELNDALGRIGDRVAIEADGAAGIVIAGDRKGDALWAGVRIENGDDRDAEHIGFLGSRRLRT